MWIMILLGGLAYLITGRFLGKLTILELKQETASEDLNVFQKGVRMLLFPRIYWYWGDRMVMLSRREWPFEEHCLSCVQRYEKKMVVFDASGEEKYYHIITFLWPFKLFRAFCGAAEIAYFVCAGVARGVSSALFFVEAPFRWLEVRGRTPNAFSISFQKKETIARLKAQQNDFDVQFKRLRELNGELAEKLVAIEGSIEYGDRVADTFTAGSSGKRQAIELVTRLHEKRVAVATEKARVEAATNAFDAKKKELDASLELLKLYYRADEFEVSDDEKLAERVREEILSTLRSCAELYRQGYDAERSMMVQMNSDVEMIADHIVEGEERVEGLGHAHGTQPLLS